MDLVLILYKFYKFQSICVLFVEIQEANKTLCIGNPEVYVNLEINIHLLFIYFFAFFHVEPFTFSYCCHQLLAELDHEDSHTLA